MYIFVEYYPELVEMILLINLGSFRSEFLLCKVEHQVSQLKKQHHKINTNNITRSTDTFITQINQPSHAHNIRLPINESIGIRQVLRLLVKIEQQYAHIIITAMTR